MNIIKILIASIIISMLSACGTGEFFIKRAVNGLQDDVADEFKSYADFDKSQERQIDDIAQQVDAWVRGDRLPVLYTQLGKIAQDIEDSSQISEQTWAPTISFLERPMNLASQRSAVEAIAKVAHSMTDEQARQAIKRLEKDYQKTLKEQRKVTLKKQNKKLAKGFKVVFSELGISRSKAQLSKAKSMLAQRKSHIDLDNQATGRDYDTFIKLVRNRGIDQADYIAAFMEAWETAERGAKHKAPELWEHNAKVAVDVLNYLLSDLDMQQRQTAAKKIGKYIALFKQLSVNTQ